MEIKDELIILIDIILELIQIRINRENNKETILITLYDRYVTAKEILESNQDVSKIMISGGCRAYLDSYSDYLDPILDNMGKAEELLNKLKSSL